MDFSARHDMEEHWPSLDPVYVREGIVHGTVVGKLPQICLA